MTERSILSAEKGFLGLPEGEACGYEGAGAVIVPFGLEESVSYGAGTGGAPEAILRASREVELFDERFWCAPYREIGIATLDIAKPVGGLAQGLAEIEGVVRSVFGDGKFPLVLGGEHSITPAILRGVRAVCEEEIVILHFDAHADLREEYGGVRDGHASALRRALEVPKTRLVSCGVRNISEEEVAFFEGSDSIDIFWAREKENWDRKKLRSLLEGKRIYLTIDVDVFDMSLMPATGTPEPGGLFWEEVLAVIELAAKAGTIIGTDITELAPIKGLHGCDFLVAKLAYSILAYAFLRNFEGD